MKKNVTLTFLFASALFLTRLSLAQTTNILEDKIEWRVTGSDSTTLRTTRATFTTNGSSISWVQFNADENENEVTRETSFEVTGTEGSWSDVAQDGQMKFLVKYKSAIGSIVIAREGSEYRLTLFIDRTGRDQLVYNFNVTSYEKK